MRILLIELSSGGHHAEYATRIRSAFLAQGVTVEVAAPRDLLPESGSAGVSFPLDAAECESALRQDSLVGREFRCWQLMRRIYHAVVAETGPIDHVVLPYLDYCAYAFGLLGSPFGRCPWTAIVMRPSFHMQGMGVEAPRPSLAAVKQFLFKQLLSQKTLVRLFTIDELLDQFTRERWPKLASRIEFFPDPVELEAPVNRGEARRLLGVPENNCTLLVYGAVDGRKGVDKLLDALKDWKGVQGLTLLIVGRQTNEVRERLRRAPGESPGLKVISVDQYVDKATEARAFAATDLVWLGYVGHFTMSGVLVLAARNRKRALATNAGLLGWYVRRLDLGIATDITQPQLVRDALALLRSKPTSESDHFDQHTWSNSSARLLTAVRAVHS